MNIALFLNLSLKKHCVFENIIQSCLGINLTTFLHVYQHVASNISNLNKHLRTFSAFFAIHKIKTNQMMKEINCNFFVQQQFSTSKTLVFIVLFLVYSY